MISMQCHNPKANIAVFNPVTVILEKPIRIPRFLSVKASHVLKGFLNKVNNTLLFLASESWKSELPVESDTVKKLICLLLRKIYKTLVSSMLKTPLNFKITEEIPQYRLDVQLLKNNSSFVYKLFSLIPTTDLIKLTEIWRTIIMSRKKKAMNFTLLNKSLILRSCKRSFKN